MLAIITALRDWRQYLLGAKEPFKIWTDHANLQYFKEPHKVNCRLARWFSDMADYHFTIHHLPGNKNCRADALSRRPDYNQGIIRRQQKIFISNDEELKEEILWAHHNTPITGHPGQFQTQELIN